MTTSGAQMTKTEREGVAIRKSNSYRTRIFTRPSKSRGHGRKPKFVERLKDKKPELAKQLEIQEWILNAIS